MAAPLQVLFVCDGASSRSLIAEALLHALTNSRFEAHSAGLQEELPAPHAIEAMAEQGIALPAGPIHHINDFEQQHFDYVITLCDEARESCLAFSRDIHNLQWACPEPEKGSLDDYRRIRDQLQQQIKAWVDSLPKG